MHGFARNSGIIDENEIGDDYHPLFYFTDAESYYFKGKSILYFFKVSLMVAALFLSGSQSGNRGLPTLKPI